MFHKQYMNGGLKPLFCYHHAMNYQAKLSAPFGMLGIRCEQDALTGIDFLPAGDIQLDASSLFAENV